MTDVTTENAKASYHVQGIGAGATLNLNDEAQLSLRTYGKYYDQRKIVERMPFQTPEQLKTWPASLPEDNPNFVERELLTTELHEKLLQSSKPVVLCALHGLGGIGKTTLALHHIHDINVPYLFRGWLDASDNVDNDSGEIIVSGKEKLLTQYRTLALEAGLVTDEDAKNSNVVIRQVLQWFSKHPNWLLVFDNASDYETIKGFLPEEGGKIIITSRASHWKNIEAVSSITVPIMTESEAIELIKRLSDYQELGENAKILAKTLGYLPLAIGQAATYIGQQNQQCSYTIDDYLKEYEQERKELLAEDSLSKKWSKTPHEPVAVTWRINMKALRKKEPLTENLMQFCAYFDNKSIPQTLLKQCLQQLQPTLTDRAFRNILSYTQEYSFLAFERGNTVSLHQLVQAVIQDQLPQEKQLEAILTAIEAISKEAPQQEPTIADIKRRKNLISHIQSIKEHSKKLLTESNKLLQTNVQSLLLLHLADIHYELGEAYSQKQLLENTLEIQKEYYGQNHWLVAETLEKLACAYSDLGDTSTQKELLERALTIKEAHYGKDNSQLVSILANLANVFGVLGDTYKKKQLLEQVLAIDESRYHRNHWIVAITLVNLAITYGELGDAYKQKKLLERALKIQKTHYGEGHWVLAITLRSLADAYGNLDDAHTKKTLLDETLAIQENFYGEEHWQVAITLKSLASVFGVLGDMHKQKQLLERALTIEENYFGKDHCEVVATLGDLAIVYGDLGDVHTEKELLERVLVMDETHYGKNHWQVATALMNLANAFGALGDAHKMKQLLERALSIREEYYGKDHWKVAEILVNLANAFCYLGDARKQKQLAERALAIQEVQYGKEHSKLAPALKSLASAFGALSDTYKEKQLLERTLAIEEAYYSKDHWERASTLEALGRTYGALGDAYKMKQLLERALVIKEEHYGKDHWRSASTLVNLGIAFGFLGDLRTKKQLLERALVIKEGHYGKEHWEVASTLINLANTYNKLGEGMKEQMLIDRARFILDQTLAYERKYHDESQDKINMSPPGVYIENLEHSFVFQPLFVVDQAVYAGDIDKAVQHYEQHISNHPKEAGDAYHNLACCYHMQGNHVKANETFQKAIKTKPNSGIYCEYAHFLYVQERYFDALMQLFEAGKCHDNHDLWYGQSEKSFIETALEDEITRYGEISIRTDLLTCYLLVRCCKELGIAFNDYSILAQFFKEDALPISLQKLNERVTTLNTPQAYRLLSYTYQYLGKHDSANMYLQKAQTMSNENNLAKKESEVIEIINLPSNPNDKEEILSKQQSASASMTLPINAKEQSLLDDTPSSGERLSLTPQPQQQRFSHSSSLGETGYPFHAKQKKKGKQPWVANDNEDIVFQLTQWLSIIELEESEDKNQRNFYGTEPYPIHYQEGDCLFASIATFLPHETVMSLRTIATQRIERDEDLKNSINALINSEVSETLRTKEGDKFIRSFQQYIMLMQTEETWGTAIEIIALARSLQRPIAILTPNNQYDYIVEEEAYQDNGPIFLNYVAEIHYAPLSVPDNKNAIDILNEIRTAIEERNNEREGKIQKSSSSNMAL